MNETAPQNPNPYMVPMSDRDEKKKPRKAASFPVVIFCGMFFIGAAFPYVSSVREKAREAQWFPVDQKTDLSSLRLPAKFFTHPALLESLWSSSVQGVVVGKKENVLTLAPLVVTSRDGLSFRQSAEAAETLDLFMDPAKTRVKISPKNPSTLVVRDGTKIDEAKLFPARPMEIAPEKIKIGDYVIGFVRFESVKDGWRAVAETITIIER